MIKLLHNNYKIKMLLNRIWNLTLVFTLITTIVFAGGTPGDFVSDVVDELSSGAGVFQTIREIITILSALGFIIAVLKLAQIGLMMMMSGTSKRSDAKSSLIPWAVGAAVCLLFGSVGPWVMSLIMAGGSGGVFDI